MHMRKEPRQGAERPNERFTVLVGFLKLTRSSLSAQKRSSFSAYCSTPLLAHTHTHTRGRSHARLHRRPP